MIYHDLLHQRGTGEEDLSKQEHHAATRPAPECLGGMAFPFQKRFKNSTIFDPSSRAGAAGWFFGWHPGFLQLLGSERGCFVFASAAVLQCAPCLSANLSTKI